MIINLLDAQRPEEMEDVMAELEDAPGMTLEFAGPWLAYVAQFDGRTGAQLLLERFLFELPPEAVEWIARASAAPCSIWEVVGVQPGRLVLRDLLTFEERTVHEVAASRTATKGTAILARVVDAGERSLLGSVYSRPLSQQDGVEIAERVRKFLRLRRAVPVERLRSERVAWRLLSEWVDVLEARSAPLRLTNREGHPLLFTTDRWSFQPKDRAEVMARIRTMANVEEGVEGFVVLSDGKEDRSVRGSIKVGKKAIRLETLSVERADELAAKVEQACGPLLGRRVRSHTDPLSSRREPQTSSEPGEPDPERAEMIRGMKERHYAKWLDQPLPMFEGRTPREMSRTAPGRRRLEAALRRIEEIESGTPPEARFDVKSLREAPGLTR